MSVNAKKHAKVSIIYETTHLFTLF